MIELIQKIPVLKTLLEPKEPENFLQEIFHQIGTLIYKLQEAGLLRLVISLLSFFSTLALLKIAHRILSKRLNLEKIRGSILIMIFLIATLVFFLILGDSSLLKVVNSFISFLLILVCIKIIDHTLIEEFLIRKKRFKISRLPRDTIKGLFFITLFLIMLNSFFGISLQGLGITAAVMTGVLGFALQDTLSSVIAGFSISIEKPFRVGNWVKVNNIEGRVEQISWRTTRIKTFYDDYIVVPNRNISNTEIFNFHAPTRTHSRELAISVDYSHPPEQVKTALLQSATVTTGIMELPAPVVRLNNYADFAINYKIKFWIDDFSKYPQIESDLLSKIWYNFKRNAITIPFPIRDVRIKQKSEQPLQYNNAVSPEELGRHTLFDELTIAHTKILAQYFSRSLYGKGEVVFHAGTSGDYLYIINRGSAAVLKNNNETKEYVSQLETGEIFGEMSMITGDKRNATIQTDTETELFCLHRNDFKTIIQKYPAIAKKIGMIIEKRKHDEKAKHSKRTKKTAVPEIMAHNKPSTILENLKKYFGL